MQLPLIAPRPSRCCADFRSILKGPMKNTTSSILRTAVPILFVLLSGPAFIGYASAQNPELQQQVANIQQSMAKNKQSLASYTWNEQVTISLKGEEKKQ